MKNLFWSWNESGESPELEISGVISEDAWWGDEFTPQMFKDQLKMHDGKDIVVRINSYGGEVVAGSQIYTMILEHRGRVTVRITGIAASVASVIAMAGSTVEMSPTAMMMIHNPWTVVQGDAKDLKQAVASLEEIKEGLVNAYERKTRLSRDEISKLMDRETYLSAQTAIEKGFADKIIETSAAIAQHNFAVDCNRSAIMACVRIHSEHATTEAAENNVAARKQLSEEAECEELYQQALIESLK